MARKEIIKQFEGIADSPTTSRTEMGFQFSINRQLERIAMVKSMITPSSPDSEFIDDVLMLEACVKTLEDFLINEVTDDKGYEKVLESIKRVEDKISNKESFVNATYKTQTSRRSALKHGEADVKYNKYRALLKLEAETLRWRGLIRLMKRHNLLLKRKVWEEEL